MERAVLLSDIEFLDGVHESDWERIEEDSFLVNVSTPLNENQQIVLEWLKDNVLQDGTSAMCSVFQFGTLWEMRRFNDQEAIRVDNAYCELNNDEQFQVLQAFAEWGKEKVMK